jgi:hypothetical protein
MTQTLAFPLFDDPKLKQLVSDLERQFARTAYRPRRQSFVNADTYEMAGTDEVIHVDYTVTGLATINLSSPQLFIGRAVVINDRGNNASVNNINLNYGGSTIFAIAANGECMTIASDGTNWYIEARN